MAHNAQRKKVRHKTIERVSQPVITRGRTKIDYRVHPLIIGPHDNQTLLVATDRPITMNHLQNAKQSVDN